MKKYQLIKIYPGSPNLGSIYEQQPGSSFYRCGIQVMFKDYIENQEEHWKEIIQKDYEILSFICTVNLNALKKGIIVNRIENSFIFEYNELRISDVESKFLEIPHWNIHSIKRLSDGEIFTIGDNVKTKNHNTKSIISNFYIGTHHLQKHMLFFGGGISIDNIKKIKQPLFITEDGVSIFEGDTYSYVNPLLSTFHIKAYADHNVREGVKMFSTEEKAKEYVLMNKKSLSVEDVLSVWTELSGNTRESLLSQSVLMFRIIKFLKNK